MSQLLPLLPQIEFKLDPPFITALVLIITLVITILTYLKMRKTEQIKLAHDFYQLHKDLQEKRAKLENLSKPKSGAVWQEWAERYFDNLEWFAYLVNSKQIKDPRLLAFYEQVILVSYKKGLPTFYSEEKIKEKNFYPELRELYEKLKNGKIKVHRYKT
jgi:hypothetical protein